MKVFTCEDRFEVIAAGIYDAWEWALKGGHDRVSLRKEPIRQWNLFDEYEHVEPDEEKAEKVVRSIRRKIGNEALMSVYYATLYDEDALDDIYQFLRVGFAYGPKVTNMLTEPAVMRMMEIRRRVGNEKHSFVEFTRFDSVNGVFVSHIEPKCNIVYLVAEDFADRMPSENWMIIDDNRKIAAVHPKDGTNYLRYLSDEEMERLGTTEEADEFTRLWSAFFRTIAIRERENPACQRNHIPLWKRKHTPEFHHSGGIQSPTEIKPPADRRRT